MRHSEQVPMSRGGQHIDGFLHAGRPKGITGDDYPILGRYNVNLITLLIRCVQYPKTKLLNFYFYLGSSHSTQLDGYQSLSISEGG